MNVTQNGHNGFDFYYAEKPVISEASIAQQELEKLREENAKLKKRVKDYQTKFAKVNTNSNQGASGEGGGQEGGDDMNDNQMEKMCSNDKVIQSINQLIEKNKSEKSEKQKEFKELSVNHKNLIAEVEQLNTQIEDLNTKERDILKQIQMEIQMKSETAGMNSEAKKELKAFEKSKNKEIKDITKASNSRKTMLHQQLLQKEKLKYEITSKLSNAKNYMDDSAQNEKIFQEVIKERRRFLMSSYLMKGQDDLEQILESLHDHFKSIQLTSFEELARNNHENLSAKQLLDHSSSELIQLAQTLELLQMDEEDVRYDVFCKIYDMLFDNIQLRVKQNKLSSRLLTQSQLNLDKTAAQFFREHHHTLRSNLEMATNNFRDRLAGTKEMIDRGGDTPGRMPLGEIPSSQRQMRMSEDQQSSVMSQSKKKKSGGVNQSKLSYAHESSQSERQQRMSQALEDDINFDPNGMEHLTHSERKLIDMMEPGSQGGQKVGGMHQFIEEEEDDDD